MRQTPQEPTPTTQALDSRPEREFCDAEVGRPGKPWHICRRKASIKVTRCSRYSGHELTLYFCKRHEGRSTDATHYTTRLVTRLEATR